LNKNNKKADGNPSADIFNHAELRSFQESE